MSAEREMGGKGVKSEGPGEQLSQEEEFPLRELRGSGARECIIKKQETSSFSPPLVKILNGDFMLPALLTCCLVLAPALVRAYIYDVSVTSGCVCVSARV